MSRTSGPIVPEMAFSWLVLPVVRFLSSYFVLIRLSDSYLFRLFQAAALHGRTTESSACVAEARTSSRVPEEVRFCVSSRCAPLRARNEPARFEKNGPAVGSRSGSPLGLPLGSPLGSPLGFCRRRRFCRRGRILFAE